MTRLSLLGEHGVCLCSLLGLPWSPLHVCIIETGVECCSVVGLSLLLSSSSTSSSECSPPVTRSMFAKAQATLCLDICFSWNSRPQVLSLAIIYLLLELFHRCTSLSDLQIGRPTTHFPLFTPTPFPCHWHHNTMTASFPFPGHLKPLTMH